MRIDPLIRNLHESTGKIPTVGEGVKPGGSDSFAAQLKAKVAEVNQLQAASDAAMTDGAAGGAQDIHETMIRLEEADIGMRLLTKVRNKAVDAYHELMRMQF
jgi:flagellar hook-basal body complex protein FliE